MLKRSLLSNFFQWGGHCVVVEKENPERLHQQRRDHNKRRETGGKSTQLTGNPPNQNSAVVGQATHVASANEFSSQPTTRISQQYPDPKVEALSARVAALEASSSKIEKTSEGLGQESGQHEH